MSKCLSQRFIDKFEIFIGQPAIGGVPVYDAVLTFKINEWFVQVKLEDFKQWIDTISESKGDRNEQAYKAKKQLDMLFNELLQPWMKLPEQHK